MNAKVEIDTREFDAALKQCIATTSRTLAKAINDKAGGVAFRAYNATPKAERSRIAAEFNARYDPVIGKRGKPTKRKKLVVTNQPRARALLVAQLRRQGKLGSVRNLGAMVNAFVSRRIASAGFLRSGWIPAIRALAKGSVFEPKKGRPVGRALVAKDSLSPLAEIENNATPKEKSKSPSAERILTLALQKAFREETGDMQGYLARKAQEAANTVNAVKK
jgi:hypothetical protein